MGFRRPFYPFGGVMDGFLAASDPIWRAVVKDGSRIRQGWHRPLVFLVFAVDDESLDGELGRGNGRPSSIPRPSDSRRPSIHSPLAKKQTNRQTKQRADQKSLGDFAFIFSFFFVFIERTTWKQKKKGKEKGNELKETAHGAKRVETRSRANGMHCRRDA